MKTAQQLLDMFKKYGHQGTWLIVIMKTLKLFFSEVAD